LAADNRLNGFLIGAMVFNRKGNFFLNLDEKAPTTPVSVAPLAEPKADAPAKPVAKAASAKPAAQAAPAAKSAAASNDEAAAPSTSVLTTAEAIAAELAAAQAARPAVSMATFAADCLVPGASLPQRRRRGGANLASFRGMASGLFGKK
jgi:hypothetical protein